MPTLKTEILGSQIEISFKENEREKLQRLISNFKKRLIEFPSKNGMISNNTIMFLAALKAEDQLEEIKNLVHKIEENKNKNIQKNNIIEKLTKEIIFLKDKINELNTITLSEDNSNSEAIQEMIKLENMLQKIQQKILLKNDDKY